MSASVGEHKYLYQDIWCNDNDNFISYFTCVRNLFSHTEGAAKAEDDRM
jgi:hypothetical protein